MTRSHRPLSPHLSIYNLPLTARTSILHRMTGVALAAGSLLLVAWLWGLAYDPVYFEFWQAIAVHPVGLIILGGWSFALFYHLGNGIRHLVWDTGRGLDVNTARNSGVVVLLFAAATTAISWYFICETLY